MRWKRTGPSSQVEDRRGRGGLGAGGLGGLPGGRMAGGGLGLIGLLLALFLGGGDLLGGGGGGGGGFGIDPGTDVFGTAPPTAGNGLDSAPRPDDQLAEFVTFVVEDVQASWEEQFRAAAQQYPATTLVLFEDGVQTGCGSATSATGPFYCPADSKVYLDLGFFRDLSTRFGAPGDFAQAYVIAHEFGHHVQNVRGTNERVRREQQRNPDDANELSVRLELQADCFAGVWAHSAYQDELLEAGDLEEGLEAAAAVGDDRIQKEATGRTDPHSYTHGTSAQRTEWFTKGYESGRPDSCDTFS
ncbi:MAG TPA: neutral zinc metallopeptidase [Acidimicrobiales bacterium]|nr:neutral zinc metallopeptidase [Acidimicrobiales bacterium]